MPAQKEDPEILAMKRVMKALQGLSTNQRYRVLSWVEGKNNENITVARRGGYVYGGPHDTAMQETVKSMIARGQSTAADPTLKSASGTGDPA